MRRGEPRSRRTHRTPRGEIRTRLYPSVWVTILPTLAPAQTLQSRLLGSTVCARSAQRLQSGGVLPAPDPPGPARALLSQRKRANEWEAGAPQRGAAKTSREEQRPTAGLAPAPRRLLRSQCSRGEDGVTAAHSTPDSCGASSPLRRVACYGPRAVFELPGPLFLVRKINFELPTLHWPWCAPKTAERARHAAGDQRDHPKEGGAGEGGGGRRRGGGGARSLAEAAEAN